MRLVSFGFVGVEPEVMGVGPIPSTEKALRIAGLTIDDIGLFELNEAFAVQVLAFLDHFGIADDDPRVNPWGGAIAIGHPLASSGVRLMTQLARQFAEHPEVRYGLTAMCIGIGMGGTVIWENPHWEGETSERDRRTERGRHQGAAAPGGRTRAGPARRAHHARQRLRPHQAEHASARAVWPAWTRRSTAALAAEPAFIAVTGKPYIFCVGADITGMPALEHREQALEIGRLGHRVFARLKDSAVPTFAFVNGAAMGGGLELALHCHYRTLSAGAAALALPEVSLGLVPGWGGTQLLPNLIGIADRPPR